MLRPAKLLERHVLSMQIVLVVRLVPTLYALEENALSRVCLIPPVFQKGPTVHQIHVQSETVAIRQMASVVWILTVIQLGHSPTALFLSRVLEVLANLIRITAPLRPMYARPLHVNSL